MKVLFVNPFGIGDVLFTTPLIRPLKKRGDSVYYWCNERVSDILAHNESIEAVFPLSRGDIKRIFKRSPIEAAKRLFGLIKHLRRERFDMALDFSLDYRYSLLLRFLGIKKIAGFDYKGRGRFLTDKVDIEGFSNRHMVEHYAALLKFIDESIAQHGAMELFVGGNEEIWASEFLKQRGINSDDILVGIAPGGGTSWGKDAIIKRWPKERFAYTAEELASNRACKILIIGSEDESSICEFISAAMKYKPINVCGRVTLGQLAALLKRCKLLIANDGGPLHMASALGINTVSIFGPVDEKVYCPYPQSSAHVVIKGDADCRPCYKNFKYPSCADRVCLDSIDPSAVLEAARRNLKW